MLNKIEAKTMIQDVLGKITPPDNYMLDHNEVEDITFYFKLKDGTEVTVDTAYSPRADMTFIMTTVVSPDDRETNYSMVSGFYYGEPELNATVKYMNRNMCVTDRDIPVEVND